MDGRATFISVASRTIIRKPVQSTTRAIQRFCSAVLALMSNRTGWGSGINRSGYSHQDRGLVARVVQRPQRQIREPQDRTLGKRPAAAAQALQLDRSADDDYQLIR